MSTAPHNHSPSLGQYARLVGSGVLASLAPPAASAIMLAVLATQRGAPIAALYGGFAQAQAVVLLACVGITVATTRQAVMARRAAASDPAAPRAGFVTSSRSVLPAAAVTLIGLVIMIAASAPGVPNDLRIGFAALWLGAAINVLMAPLLSWQGGVLMAAQQDAWLMRMTVGRTAIMVISLVAVAWSAASDTLLCAVMGLAYAALAPAMWWTGRARIARCSPQAVGAIRQMWQQGRLNALRQQGTWRAYRTTAMAAADGIIMMSFLFLVGAVASWQSAQDAVVVMSCIAIMRIVVLPMKRAGMVAGRLSLQHKLPVVRVALRFSGLSVLMAAISAAVLLVSHASGWFLSGHHRIVLALMLFQLIVEPLCSYLPSYMNVRVAPSFSARPYFLVVVLGMIPATIVLSVAGYATPEALWGVFAVGRAMLAIAVCLLVGRVSRADHDSVSKSAA